MDTPSRSESHTSTPKVSSPPLESPLDLEVFIKPTLHPLRSGRYHWVNALCLLIALHFLGPLESVVAQDALPEFLALRARFGTNRFLSFNERSAYSSGVSEYRCEWTQTAEGFRFQRRPRSEDSGDITQATLWTPDRQDTLLQFQVLRRTATNRYESPVAFYLSNRPITECRRFSTNIGGAAAIAFELRYALPQPAGPVPESIHEVVVFDSQGYLRALHTLESTTNNATPFAFPIHFTTTFDAYATTLGIGKAIPWDQYPVTQVANAAQESNVVSQEVLVKFALIRLRDLPWTIKIPLILLPMVVLVGALLYLIFGRSRTNSE